MTLSIEALTNRIKEYEAEIVKVVTNHGNLMGGLNELKQLLSIATGVVDVVDPSAAPVLDVISEVVDEVDAAVQS